MFTYVLGFLAFFAANSFISACYISNSTTFPKPLSANEEDLYLEKLRGGDMDAKNILIERNLRLVAHVVKKFTTLGCKDSDDLISIGTIGLIKGVTSYKNSKGTRLATYAAKCIENATLSMRLKFADK